MLQITESQRLEVVDHLKLELPHSVIIHMKAVLVQEGDRDCVRPRQKGEAGKA